MNARSRTIVWIDVDAEIVPHDDGPAVGTMRRVDIEVGGTIVGFGRLGIATDEEIIGLADRLTTALGEVRAEAVARLNKGTTPFPAESPACDSPLCALPGSHFAGAVGCVNANRIARPPTRLRASSGHRPVPHDDELHSGYSPIAPPFLKGCPACDQEFYRRESDGSLAQYARIDPNERAAG